MASPAPPAPPVAPGAPGAGGSEGAEEALGSAAGRRRRPPLSALSAFSRIPAGREGPPELSYFHREAKEMFPLMIPFLKDQRVTTKIFTDVTENTQRVVVLTLMRSFHKLIIIKYEREIQPSWKQEYNTIILILKQQKR
ncbi:cilia- and flagella-associated protein 90 isoform 2-T2 [Theristicus caerulescens]